MTFDEYQKEAAKTAKYPDIGNNYVYPTLGVVGEAGEIAEKVKKIIREDKGKISKTKKKEIKKEMGDVLWYLSKLADELKLSFNDIAETNVKKLNSRAERNVIHGSGDNR